MSNSISNAGNETPDQLLAIFSQTKISHGIFVGILLHLLLVGATSSGYFKKVEVPAAALASEKQQTPITAQPDAPGEAASLSKERPESAPSETKRDEQLLEERNQSPIVKAITEQTPSAKAPSVPEPVGLSLEDTEPGR